MKYLLIFSTVACVGLLLTSCDEWLDAPAESYIEADRVETQETVNITVMGCYNGMQTPIKSEWALTELRSDNTYQGQPNSTSVQNFNYNDLDMFRPSASLDLIYEYWQACYHNINNTNNVLKNIEKWELNNELKQYKGEVLFIRAYHYFNLVRLFGPVFIVTHPLQPDEAKGEERHSVKEVYELIIDDLKTAVEYLPSSYNAANIGRATKWAATALLAKVYLTYSGMDNTWLDKADELLDELQRPPATADIGLLGNYADVFSITNELNREILFAIRFKAGGYGLGSTFANNFAALNAPGLIVGNGRGLNHPNMSIYNAYSPDDPRKAVNIAVFDRASDTLYVGKFFSKVALIDDGENDWPVLRYADVLLMSAEVKARLGNIAAGYEKLNLTHTRGGQLLPIPETGSLALFMESLQLERRLELAFENDRFFDLVRWEIASRVLTDHLRVEEAEFYSRYPSSRAPRNDVDEWRLLLPIPQREIDTNNEIRITQNFGY